MPRRKRDYANTKAAHERWEYKQRVAAQMAAARPKLDGDPAIALYRAERAAGQLRFAPLLDAAKATLERLMADLEKRGRGGRPRKSNAS